MKEATARIKINKLLEAAGWRFFPEGNAPANIRLEPSVTIKSADLDALGETSRRPKEDSSTFFCSTPRASRSSSSKQSRGQEPARRQGTGPQVRALPELPLRHSLQRQPALLLGPRTWQPVRHHLFPTPDSVIGYQKVTPKPERLIAEQVGDDYIVLTQRPSYRAEAGWRNDAERPDYIRANKLRFLRPYQLKAIHSLQAAVDAGKDRFLFEMATGTGKTLTAAAVIKLFLRSGNASRVLFLVDRLELEEQARRLLSRCYPPTFRRSSTRRTGMTGAARRSSSPLCSPCFSTTSTRSSSPRPISTSSSPTKRTAPSAVTPARFSTTSSATSSA